MHNINFFLRFKRILEPSNFFQPQQNRIVKSKKSEKSGGKYREKIEEYFS